MEKSKRSFLPWGMVSTILTLAWPTMLEELMQTAVQYIDTAMVGAIGTQATAAVGATSTVNWLIGSTVAAIGVGFLSFVSQACGAGDTKRAPRLPSGIASLSRRHPPRQRGAHLQLRHCGGYMREASMKPSACRLRSSSGKESVVRLPRRQSSSI